MQLMWYGIRKCITISVKVHCDYNCNEYWYSKFKCKHVSQKIKRQSKSLINSNDSVMDSADTKQDGKKQKDCARLIEQEALFWPNESTLQDNGFVRWIFHVHLTDQYKAGYCCLLIG